MLTLMWRDVLICQKHAFWISERQTQSPSVSNCPVQLANGIREDREPTEPCVTCAELESGMASNTEGVQEHMIYTDLRSFRPEVMQFSDLKPEPHPVICKNQQATTTFATSFVADNYECSHTPPDWTRENWKPLPFPSTKWGLRCFVGVLRQTPVHTKLPVKVVSLPTTKTTVVRRSSEIDMTYHKYIIYNIYCMYTHVLYIDCTILYM